jgi:hypothetical protein
MITQKNGWFLHNCVLVISDWVAYFWGLVGAIMFHCHLRPPEVGKGNSKLSFGSNLAQFGSL